MTRETKIGLLVGLAFIIVIGILLSDHINSSTDPVRADMTATFGSVEQSVKSPGDAQPAAQGSTVVVTQRPVVPQNPVPTQHDAPTGVSPGTEIIKIGPGGDPSQLQLPRASANRTQTAPPPAEQQPSNDAISQPPVQAQPDDAAVAQNGGGGGGGGGGGATSPDGNSGSPTDRLRAEARARGEDLVAPGTPPAADSPVGIRTTPVPGNTVATLPAGLRQVKAEEGDSLSRLAAKYMGANNKANREAILKLNPSMTPDGHLVIAGKSYLIPTANAAPAGQPATLAERRQPAAAPATHQPTAAAAAQPQPAPAAPPGGGSWYTVKENDNLWRIAADQLGSGTRWTEIRDLNADLLKGNEQLHVNMRLKLPQKSIAAND